MRLLVLSYLVGVTNIVRLCQLRATTTKLATTKLAVTLAMPNVGFELSCAKNG